MIPNLLSKRENTNSISETPSFVRNVMGSSAGAGSGEFHVYRHLRRKEYARQKQIQQQSTQVCFNSNICWPIASNVCLLIEICADFQEQMDEDFRNKLEQNRLQAELKTAKKRAKRLKKKQRTKKPKPNDGNSRTSETRSTESSDNDSDEGGDKSQTNANNESKSDCDANSSD